MDNFYFSYDQFQLAIDSLRHDYDEDFDRSSLASINSSKIIQITTFYKRWEILDKLQTYDLLWNIEPCVRIQSIKSKPRILAQTFYFNKSITLGKCALGTEIDLKLNGKCGANFMRVPTCDLCQKEGKCPTMAFYHCPEVPCSLGRRQPHKIIQCFC